MNKHQYANYSLKDFNKFDCLKLSIGIYAILTFVTRGYLVWIISISNINNQTDAIEMIFPEPEMFYLSLVSGVVGLFIILIICLRRPNASQWVRFCWQYLRAFLSVALIVDIVVSIIGCYYLSLLSPQWLLIQFIITLLFIVYLYTNNRVKLNIKEFPEHFEK